MQNLHRVMRIEKKGLVGRRTVLKAMSAGIGAAWAMVGSAQPQPVRVVAASDLQYALPELADLYQRQTGITVVLTLGSSGNFAQQLRQGLPADLFLSADEAFVFSLADAGLTQDRGALYALGRIAVHASPGSTLPLDARLSGLRASWEQVSRFAIANPEHAPYGRAARQALETLGLWEQVKPKLVLGENVSQATQFVVSGAAPVGITALSLLLAPQGGLRGRHVVLPESLHAPLRQRMVLLKSATPAARGLHDYLQSAAAREVLQRHGFSPP
jgi:molybdate transport system substrate-binding protein